MAASLTSEDGPTNPIFLPRLGLYRPLPVPTWAPPASLPPSIRARAEPLRSSTPPFSAARRYRKHTTGRLSPQSRPTQMATSTPRDIRAASIFPPPVDRLRRLAPRTPAQPIAEHFHSSPSSTQPGRS